MDIMSIIRQLQDKRREEKITPDHVPETELLNTISSEARKELNELYQSGKIGLTKTLNGKAVFVKEKVL